MDGSEVAPESIGQRARRIRRRRGLSMTAAAGLAGISQGYLSMLERGHRNFERRGLLENLANALGCSVMDLTGEPYASADRESAIVRAAVPGVRLALNDYMPDDTPDVRPRPLAELLAWADQISAHRDQADYAAAGRDLGILLVELQRQAQAGSDPERRRAQRALIESWAVAGAVTRSFGYVDLAAAAARRGCEVALRLGDPALLGFSHWFWAYSLMRLASRKRARDLLIEALDELKMAAHFDSPDTAGVEITGLIHLALAQVAARDDRADDAHAHLKEAGGLANRTGERNSLRRHFGPTNVAAWRVSIGIELGEGRRAYAEAIRTPMDTLALGSNERTAALHLDFARALAEDDGSKDLDAIRHLDTADRLAPQLIRPDPIARELVATLSRRSRRNPWELDSLRRRLGLIAQ